MMTIERLEELEESLNYAFALLAKDYPRSNRVQEDHKDIRSLITDEISRQSVTDEEICDAMLSIKTFNWEIDLDTYPVREDDKYMSEKTKQVILSALSVYRTTEPTDEEIQDIVNEAHDLLDDEVHDKCDYPTYVRLKDIVYELGDLADRPYQTLESTDKEMQDAIAWLKSMSELGYKPTADKAKIALQALQLFGKSEHVGNGDKSGCKCEQAVCLNGTAYCANCRRKM